jgi:hypothetical protein
MRRNPVTYDANARYDHFNTVAFQNVLPKVPVTFKKLKSVGGRAYGKFGPDSNGNVSVIPSSLRIDLDTSFARTDEQFDALLVHEMLHIYFFWTGRFREAHGAKFQEFAKVLSKKLGIEVPLTENTAGLALSDDYGTKKIGVMLVELPSGMAFGLLTPKALNGAVEMFGMGTLPFARSGARVALGLVETPLWTRLAADRPVHKSTKGMKFWKLSPEAEQDFNANAQIFVDQREPKDVRENPFHAFAKFKGRAARLRAWEGGFHTALKRDLVIPYAQMKWDNDPDDYPVILTFDMTGLTRFTDIDVRRAADMFFEHCAVNQYHVGREDVDSDQILEALDLDLQEDEDPDSQPQSGDDAQNAMWKMSGSPSVLDNALRLALGWIRGSGLRLERLYEVGKILAKDERAKLEPSDEEMLIEAFGQCRYMFDIPDDRLIEVEYMAPFFAQVIDPDGDEDETIEEAAGAGYSFIEWGRSEIDESRETAWKRPPSELPLLEATVGRSRTSRSWEQQRIEFHGTSLKNLLMACPWLVAELPDPPSPCMSTIEDIAVVLFGEPEAEDEDEDEDDGQDDIPW